ncbi:unnamed protein product [Zymoseptoria tritici ST99CH_1A5]|uniref:YTH domain-containing protein n=1 Tax=Zymoseptoria tritici ST99CH_1A5 TaxID=1276529 RepID=A0A1Y6LIH8_ZYMTR|nr:unnamed protein product [Zymoseptoria tritici ST99CH_1A5]
MAVFGFGADEPAQNDDGIVEDDENFYGDDEEQQQQEEEEEEATHPGASSTEQQKPPVPATPQNAEVNAENQRRLEELRAKLLAQRQNTPLRPNTPLVKPVETPSKAPTQILPPPKQSPFPQPTTPQPQPQHTTMSSVELSRPTIRAEAAQPTPDVDALLSEGRARADEQIANEAAAKAATIPPAATNGNAKPQKKDVKQETAKAAPKTVPDLIVRTREPARGQANLSDAYYADLPAWLEVTGYHDVDFRNKRLASYKERKALQEEATRISRRLEELRQMEEQEARMATPVPKQTAMAPPALPSAMPLETPYINGTKRAHSPDQLSSANKRREENGFRIRGANDSPADLRPGNGVRRPRSPTPPRRISYPDTRRRSDDDLLPSRDPSLERRQEYYRNVDREGGRRIVDYRDGPEPRNGPRDVPRGGYGPGLSARGGRSQQYGNGNGFDPRKGGVKYFVIKSWNLANVHAAQRSSVWSTQTKNETLLTQAFRTSRQVILFFSVNKSMAFQGYALMTSAPDSSIAKPDFCKKLNWDTSAAFTIRWLSTTSVPFRLVGHLKNRLNLDEQGVARPVLIGKDGQEVCEEAGKGVVRVMEEVETKAVETRKAMERQRRDSGFGW